MTDGQVGGGTLVVEPGEGRDPLTVNDQVALKLFQFLKANTRDNFCPTFPSKLMTYQPVLEIYQIPQVVTKVLGEAECWLL